MSFLKKLFKPKTERTGLVFVVEDNKVYSEALKAYLSVEIPAITEVKTFPVGETCLMELHKNPDMIIIDHFLDSRFYDAEPGLEIIKKIRAEKPEVNIIVLSSQQDIDVILEMVKKYNCSFVQKDENAFGKVGELVREALA